MRISYDDQFLFSVGQDGSLFIFKVTDKDGRGLKREKDITFAEEVLVTKSDLEEKNTVMSELKTRVDELKMENDYQLRLKDMSYGEKIKDLTDKFLQEIEALKARNEVHVHVVTVVYDLQILWRKPSQCLLRHTVCMFEINHASFQVARNGLYNVYVCTYMQAHSPSL